MLRILYSQYLHESMLPTSILISTSRLMKVADPLDKVSYAIPLFFDQVLPESPESSIGLIQMWGPSPKHNVERGGRKTNPNPK